MLQQALAAGYSAPEIHYRLGIALSQLGRLDEAEKVLEQGVAAFPQAAEIHLLLGQTRIQQNKLAEAETNLRTAVRLSPEDANTHLSLATVCTRLGKSAEAAESRRRFAELKSLSNPGGKPQFQTVYLAVLRRIAITHFPRSADPRRPRRSPRAEELLLRALTLAPDRPGNLELLANVYRQLGECANARAVLLRHILIEPGNPQLQLDLANVSVELGDLPAAEAAYNHVLRDRPDSVAAYNGLARVYLQKLDFGRARVLVEEGLRWQPTAAGYLILAEIHSRSGEDEQAESARRQARDCLPTSD